MDRTAAPPPRIPTARGAQQIHLLLCTVRTAKAGIEVSEARRGRMHHRTIDAADTNSKSRITNSKSRVNAVMENGPCYVPGIHEHEALNSAGRASREKVPSPCEVEANTCHLRTARAGAVYAAAEDVRARRPLSTETPFSWSHLCTIAPPPSWLE